MNVPAHTFLKLQGWATLGMLAKRWCRADGGGVEAAEPLGDERFARCRRRVDDRPVRVAHAAEAWRERGVVSARRRARLRRRLVKVHAEVARHAELLAGALHALGAVVVATRRAE